MSRYRSLAVVVLLVAVLAIFVTSGIATASTMIPTSLAPTGGLASQTDATVEVSNFDFTPDFVSIEVGDSVTWNNVQGFHSVEADDSSFSSGPPAGAPWTFVHQFDTAGTYTYHCAVHASMTGTVEVTERSVRSAAIILRSRPLPFGNLVFGIVVVRDANNQPVPGATVD
ncbi:MAG: plastocyanin/azurin family copper-binding protein, partial [Ardenticatenaceae bacterium]